MIPKCINMPDQITLMFLSFFIRELLLETGDWGWQKRKRYTLGPLHPPPITNRVKGQEIVRSKLTTDTQSNRISPAVSSNLLCLAFPSLSEDGRTIDTTDTHLLMKQVRHALGPVDASQTQQLAWICYRGQLSFEPSYTTDQSPPPTDAVLTKILV